ncbi:hypothetical protein ViPhICP3M1_gp13 [Vibrio phage ICP3]|nr:hypothetical protein ViPhICP3M1_gp13 [Vibrio phage ICP3]USS70666.1 hypothetical protein ViPhICP3M2_gp13 [Vibrio phage ICP3]
MRVAFMNFYVTINSNGETLCHSLKSNQKNLVVTMKNLQNYVKPNVKAKTVRSCNVVMTTSI